MKETFTYMIPMNTPSGTIKDWKLTIIFVDTKKDLLRILQIYNKDIKRMGDLLGYFQAIDYPTKDQATTIGTIYFQKEKLTNELIIHEAFHAMIHVFNRIHISDISFYQERIVSGSAKLAAYLLDEFKSIIKIDENEVK